MDKLNNKAMFLVPIVTDPSKLVHLLNLEKPVSNDSNIEGIKRENNHPIIVIPGVMGSKLYRTNSPIYHPIHKFG